MAVDRSEFLSSIYKEGIFSEYTLTLEATLVCFAI